MSAQAVKKYRDRHRDSGGIRKEIYLTAYGKAYLDKWMELSGSANVSHAVMMALSQAVRSLEDKT